MGEVWEGRSYTKEDVESAIEKVARIPKMTRGAAESEVYNLLEYSMPQKKPSVLYIKVTTLRIFLRKITNHSPIGILNYHLRK